MPLGKSFIAGVGNSVERSLRSCCLRNPELELIAAEKVLYRRPSSDTNEKVVLISGGGSGHEPAHAGYLGEGALDAVVAGEIFASPSSTQILSAIKAVKSSKGALLIVKNYTGDKLNFGLAAEKAKAEGHNVDMVVVGDDVSVEGNSLVGQRGLAGVVFVHKIAGASVQKGMGLPEVTALAKRTASQMATVAVSFDRCNVPGRSHQEPLPADQLEFGMGIHNEPGVKRETIDNLQVTVQKLLDIMFKPKPGMWHPQNEHHVALMINNLGGLSVLELEVIAEEVSRQIDQKGVRIAKRLVGTFVTSLDGPGFSITLLQLDDQLEEMLDAPTTASAWPCFISASTPSRETKTEQVSNHETVSSLRSGITVPASLVNKMIHAVQNTTSEDEPKITEYDTLAGDGDCGETLLNGVGGLVKEFEQDTTGEVDIGHIFRRAATVAEKKMGGTSGGIYAIFLNAVANSLTNTAIPKTNTSPDAAISSALKQGLEELCRYTPARVGHRTLMDALIPFIQVYSEGASFVAAVDEARKGAEGTRRMAAALGRASYVGQERFDEEGGIPDPGALGIVSILRGLQSVLEES